MAKLDVDCLSTWDWFLRANNDATCIATATDGRPPLSQGQSDSQPEGTNQSLKRKAAGGRRGVQPRAMVIELMRAEGHPPLQHSIGSPVARDRVGKAVLTAAARAHAVLGRAGFAARQITNRPGPWSSPETHLK